jgi:excisionase family DNA binding protein
MLRTEGSLLSMGQAAKQLHVSSGTVRNWIEKGYISAVRYPSGQRRIPESEVTKLLTRMFEIPSQLDEEVVASPPRHRGRRVEPDEWGPAV